MKVTTEDCVDAIVDYYKEKGIVGNSPLLDFKQWKIINKSGKGNSIIRVFRNSKTTSLINVTSSETEILNVGEDSNVQPVAKINKFTAPKKRTIKCKCRECGSTDVMLVVSPGNGDDGYEIEPLELNQEMAKEMIENEDGTMWICLGECEDETSAIVEIDGKKITDSDDFIEYIADYGNPKLDNIESNSIPVKKKIDIIKAVRIGDLDAVQEYINAGNNLDTYIGDLPENKNMTGIGETNWTLLQFAIKQQQLDVAIAFINAGCDVNKPMRHISNTALLVTLWNKWTSKKIYNVIDALMTHGADLSVKSFQGDDIFDHVWDNKKPHMKYIIDNYPEQYKEYLSKK